MSESRDGQSVQAAVQWVIAVDGGGSKIGVAAQLIPHPESSEPVARALPESLDSARTWRFEGTGSAHPGTWPTASQNLIASLRSVVSELAATGHGVHSVLLALAGAGREDDQHRVVKTLQNAQLPSLMAANGRDSVRLRCVGDIDPLVDYFVDRFDEKWIVALLGTGSIAAARKGDGQLVRAGGWGPLLGDECSGGALGMAALRAVVRVLDSSPPADLQPEDRQWQRLSETIVAQLNLIDDQALPSAIIQTAADRTKVARLCAPLIRLAFDEQLPVVRQIVDSHINAFTWQICQVHRRAFGDQRPIGLLFSGGLADYSPEICQAITAACRAQGLVVDRTHLAEPLLAALRSAISFAYGLTNG